MLSLLELMLLGAGCWGALVVGRALLRAAPRLAFVPVTLVGVASILAGVAVFGSRMHDADPFGIDPAPLSGVVAVEKGPTLAARWPLIALGSLLVITGSLLACRGRTRPLVLKACTWLGLAACGVALISFVVAPVRHTGNGVWKIKSGPFSITIDDDSKSEERFPSKTIKKPDWLARLQKRFSPTKHSESAAESLAKMPPRAGSIPVGNELAKAEPQAVPASEPAAGSSPPVAERVPEPETTESAPAPEPPKEPAPVKAPPPAEAPPVAIEKPAPEAIVVVESTEPVANPPVKRPAWVGVPGKLTDSVYRVGVESGFFVTEPECRRNLDVQMKHFADEYIDDYLGEGAASAVDISVEHLRKHLKKDEFHEVRNSQSVGNMQQIVALMEFDDDARDAFKHRWHEAIVARRLWHVAAGAGLVLALLATLYGYLKLDLRTAGNHTGQLQLAAALVALIVTAGALLVQSKLPF